MKLEPLKQGSVRFFPKQQDRQNDFFEVSFLISCTHGDEFDYENTFEVGMTVAAEGRNQPFGKIEELGAQALPAYFRELANLLERDLERSLQERTK